MIKCYDDCIKNIYSNKKIVIGLTGKTGSGCSTVAKLLSYNDFKKFKFKKINQYGFSLEEEKKHKIILDYLSKDSIWKGFRIIKVSNLIIDFIISKDSAEFEKYVKNCLKQNKTNESDYISISDYESFISNIKKIIDEGHIIYNHYHDDSGMIIKDLSDEYYFDKLQEISEKSKSELVKYNITVRVEGKNVKSNCYYYLLQKIGNNIRASGEPYSNIFSGNHFSIIASKIKEIIDNYQDDSARFCIDAIRNQFEATYLKEHCSNFYLVSVNTEEKSRRERLQSLMTLEMYDSLNYIEYPKKKNSIEETFYHQNIQKCLEITDIHLYNGNDNVRELHNLTIQILKYIGLILHPGLITPNKIERCMQIAYEARINSGCLSRKVGAVITDENYMVKSIGWNEVPSCQMPCNLRTFNDLISSDKNCFSEFELQDEKFRELCKSVNDMIPHDKLIGLPYSYCFKDIFNYLNKSNNQVHTRALHAEENAFLNISKYGGIGLKGGNLFVTASPCELCAKKSYQFGIKNIYYIDPYPGISKNHILKFNEEHDPQMILYSGAIGSAYLNLYMPKISMKDELELITGINHKNIKFPITDSFDIECEEVRLIIKNDAYVYQRIIEGIVTSQTLKKIDRQILFINAKTKNWKRLKGEGYNECEFKFIDMGLESIQRFVFSNKLRVGETFKIGLEVEITDAFSMDKFLLNKIINKTNKLILKIINQRDSELIAVSSKIFNDEKRVNKVIDIPVACEKNPSNNITEYYSEFNYPSKDYFYEIDWE